MDNTWKTIDTGIGTLSGKFFGREITSIILFDVVFIFFNFLTSSAEGLCFDKVNLFIDCITC